MVRSMLLDTSVKTTKADRGTAKTASARVVPALQRQSMERENVLPKAVIFDLDGTLIDSARDVSVVLNTIVVQKGVAQFTEDEVKPFMGEGVLAVIGKALQARHVQASEAKLSRLKTQFLDIYCRERVALTKPFPYARRILDQLTRRGLAVGVCTNKDEVVAQLILQALGFDRHVRAVIGADSGFGRKPDPTPLLACASRLRVRPNQVVYVGDHRIDIETARAAKIPVVAVSYGYAGVPVSTLGANRTISCLSELPDAVFGTHEFTFITHRKAVSRKGSRQ